jgi:hypothetical protein
VTAHQDGSLYSSWFKDYNEGNMNDALYKQARVDY